MKKIKKAARMLTALMLALSVLVTSVSAEEAYQLHIAYETAATESFTGSVTAADGISVGNLKIDVYKSTLVKANTEYDKFKNVYKFSVYTDKNGSFSFTRPSDSFVMCVDMSSLPRKTGVTAETMNIGSDTVTGSFRLDYIKKVKVTTSDLENDDTQVTLMSADGTPLYANYSVSVSDYNEAADLKTVDGVTALTYLTAKITVKANGVSSTKNYKYKLPTSLKVKVQYLKVNELITTKLANKVIATIPSAQSLTLPEHEAPLYYHESGDEFQLCYNSGDYTAATLSEIAATFRGAYKLFITDNNFLPPLKRSEDDYFTIFLAPSAVGATATTKHVENGECYIVANIPTDYTVSNIDYTQTLAHELFHAISYRYTKANGVYPSTWFNEAFASWAGLAYVGRSGDWTTGYVRIYLAELAMSYHGTTKYQCYGALLLPLTIQLRYGGFESIRQILIAASKLKGKSNIEYTAINNGLKAVNSSYTRTKAFVSCMMSNMFSSYYYSSVRGSSSWADAARTASYGENHVISELIINPMSCTYFDFTPSTSSKYLYVTVSEADGKYGNLYLGCVKQRRNGKYSYFSGNVAAFYTYRFNNFSGDASKKFTLGIMNADIENTRTVNVTVQYQD